MEQYHRLSTTAPSRMYNSSPVSALAMQLEQGLPTSGYCTSSTKQVVRCVSSESLEDCSTNCEDYEDQYISSAISGPPSEEPPLTVAKDTDYVLEYQPYYSQKQYCSRSQNDVDHLCYSPRSTASMEREYDRDTWRLYERINAARARSGLQIPSGFEINQPTLPARKAFENVSRSNSDDHYYAQDTDGDEAIFELDFDS